MSTSLLCAVLLSLLLATAQSVSSAGEHDAQLIQLLQEIRSSQNATEVKLDLIAAAQTAAEERVTQLISALDSKLDVLLVQQLATAPPVIDCSDLTAGSPSGVYMIRSNLLDPVRAYCDLTTDGGGWTVIQRRGNLQPREDFFRGWEDYKTGFGLLDKEMWWGNDNVFALTSRPDRQYELRVEIADDEGVRAFATYQTFSVGPESLYYLLTIGNYSGNAGDSFQHHSGAAFSTKDRDYDGLAAQWNCSGDARAGWWYNPACLSNLNAPLEGGLGVGLQHTGWTTWPYFIQSTEMKIRPRKRG